MKVIPADGFDKKVSDCEQGYSGYEFMHICFGYSETFIEEVRDYQRRFNPRVTVIHSTVPVGTCMQLEAVHSPIQGVHPNLEQGIRTFVKFFGGPDAEAAAVPFKEVGMETKCVATSAHTEAAKLLDTTYYYWNIHYMRSVKKYCDEHKLDFDFVYKAWNSAYNAGYTELGMGHVARPVLDYHSGKTGGHCLVPNAKLLGNDIAKILLDAEEAL